MSEPGGQESQEITREQSLDAHIESSYENLLGVLKTLQTKQPRVFKYPSIGVFDNLRQKDKRSSQNLPWPLSQEGSYLTFDDSMNGNDSIRIVWESNPNTRETIEIGHHKFPTIHEQPVPFYDRTTETRERTYQRWEEQSVGRYGDEYLASNGGHKSSLDYDEYLKSDDKLLLDKVTDSFKLYAS